MPWDRLLGEWVDGGRALLAIIALLQDLALQSRVDGCVVGARSRGQRKHGGHEEPKEVEHGVHGRRLAGARHDAVGIAKQRRVGVVLRRRARVADVGGANPPQVGGGTVHAAATQAVAVAPVAGDPQHQRHQHAKDNLIQLGDVGIERDHDALAAGARVERVVVAHVGQDGRRHGVDRGERQGELRRANDEVEHVPLVRDQRRQQHRHAEADAHQHQHLLLADFPDHRHNGNRARDVGEGDKPHESVEDERGILKMEPL
mmetsp:Transcript_54302/g.161259  ORF Transcript_54302/g.161259 Transcript_54302/m.161259 type:complete len:259 (+) Transcript_54302:1828-2604(+)